MKPDHMIKKIYKSLLELGIQADENSADMIGYWDNDLICRYANHAYFDWFGVQPAEMVDKMTIQELLGPLYMSNEPYIAGALRGEVQVFKRDIPMSFGQNRQTIATYCPAFKGDQISGFYVHVEEETSENIADRLNKKKPHLPQNKFTAVRDPVNEVKNELESAVFKKFPGISNLAKQHFISEAKLKNDFKARFNRGVFSYYRFLQMELAEEYIREKRYTKKQVADLLNFTNATNFIICYHKHLKDKASQKVLGELTKANDDRYKTFISQMPFAVAMLDREMNFIAASQKYIDDYQLQFKPVSGSGFYDVFPTLDDRWKRIHKAALKGKIMNGEEHSFQRVDRSQMWNRWDVRPWRNQAGEIGGILLFTEDITAIKLKEEENKKILEILSKTSELIKIGAWKKNFKNNTGFWSKITREILEVPEDFKPTSAFALEFYKEGQSRVKMEKLLHQAITLGKSFDTVCEIITAKGRQKTVRVVGYSEFRSGKCERLFGIFQELKSRK